MLGDADQSSMEDCGVSSPLSAQILEFYESAVASICTYDFPPSIIAPTHNNIFDEEINIVDLPSYQFEENNTTITIHPQNDHFVPPAFSQDCSPLAMAMDPSLNLFLSAGISSTLPLETSAGNSPHPLPIPYYTSNQLQVQAALSNESQHLVNGSATWLASEITSLEAETFRVTNKLTTQERKEKIHRYMKKKNKRNFNKKIKYACRKTLADSRPRVRGRFARNDEFGENSIRSTHEEDTDEDVKSFHVMVKEEEEKYESSDIFAHISGVNSFKFNYPIQSWI